ncbi:MAG TPA: hypothetical protein VK932_26400 [Kofleriaceae bacterium]|nr:hypothetical protein [Kofleriaceae bacterium]
MRAWKHVLVLFGALGVLGMFAPMLELRQGRVVVELSASQLSFGFEKQHAILQRELPQFAEKLADKYLPESVRSTRRDVRLVSEAARWAALAYAPAALLALFGLIGVLRRRFGRALGTLALLAGLASIATWLGLRFGIRFALAQSDLDKTQVTLMFGAHLLLVAGVAGVIAGIGALARPDLGRPRGGPMRPGPTSPGFPPPPPPPGFPPPGFPPPGGPMLPPAGR